MTCPPISISPSAKYLWLVVVHLLVNQAHGAAFEAAAAAAAGSPTVAPSDTNDPHKFGGFAEHALAHTWVSRKLEDSRVGYAMDGGFPDVADCFVYRTNKQGICESCCGRCTETEEMDNSASGGCVCSVIGDSNPGYGEVFGEPFFGSDYNDCIYITGDDNGYIYGGDGDDTIVVSGNDNTNIYGDDGDDTITVSGDSNDYIDGGDGDDIFVISGDKNTEIDGGDGDDTITVLGDGNEWIRASTPEANRPNKKIKKGSVVIIVPVVIGAVFLAAVAYAVARKRKTAVAERRLSHSAASMP